MRLISFFDVNGQSDSHVEWLGDAGKVCASVFLGESLVAFLDSRYKTGRSINAAVDSVLSKVLAL